MNHPASSIRKTTLAVTIAAAVVAALAAIVYLRWKAHLGLALTAFGVVETFIIAAAACGLVVLNRTRRLDSGAPDLFLSLNEPRAEPSVASGSTHPGVVRRVLGRAVLGHDFLVGDVVEVLSLAEIRATLDERGRLDGLPFMPEMERLCGTRATVFRCVDKIYDYGRSRKMRSVDNCVSLVGSRCDGAAHGGCQARCLTLWNTRWLKHPGRNSRGATPASQPAATRSSFPRTLAPEGSIETGIRYVCQFTELNALSRPIPSVSLMSVLKPLVAGNITARALIVAMATRWFNRLQAWRGGNGYPVMPMRASDPPQIPPPASLSKGDTVVVKPLQEIAKTLDRNNKNRGLWFDADMIRHCGQRYEVLDRIARIIDNVSGRMLEMKHPCIILQGVDCSGEFQRFGAQNEYVFWREIWLERVASAPNPADADTASSRRARPDE